MGGESFICRLRVVVLLGLLLGLCACSPPLSTYKAAQQKYEQATDNIVQAQRTYYELANDLAVSSYIEARVAEVQGVNYQEMMKAPVISTDKVRARLEALQTLSVFAKTSLAIAMAQDAEDFGANARQAGNVASKVSNGIAQFVGQSQAGDVLSSVFAQAGNVIGAIGQHLMESDAEKRLDQIFSKSNMAKLNAVLVLLADDLIECSNRLDTILVSNTARSAAEFNNRAKYVTDLRKQWKTKRNRAYLKSINDLQKQGDELRAQVRRLMQAQLEPATEGIMSLIDLNDALVVYASSKQTKADKNALLVRANNALGASIQTKAAISIYQ